MPVMPLFCEDLRERPDRDREDALLIGEEAAYAARERKVAPMAQVQTAAALDTLFDDTNYDAADLHEMRLEWRRNIAENHDCYPEDDVEDEFENDNVEIEDAAEEDRLYWASLSDDDLIAMMPT